MYRDTKNQGCQISYDTGLSARYIFAFQESLGTRLENFKLVPSNFSFPYWLPILTTLRVSLGARPSKNRFFEGLVPRLSASLTPQITASDQRNCSGTRRKKRCRWYRVSCPLPLAVDAITLPAWHVLWPLLVFELYGSMANRPDHPEQCLGEYQRDACIVCVSRQLRSQPVSNLCLQLIVP